MKVPPRTNMSGAGFMVVGSMCVALLVMVLAVAALAIAGKDIPDVVDKIVSGLLVGVPALLAKTYSGTGAVGEQGEPGEPGPPGPVGLMGPAGTAGLPAAVPSTGGRARSR